MKISNTKPSHIENYRRYRRIVVVLATLFGLSFGAQLNAGYYRPYHGGHGFHGFNHGFNHGGIGFSHFYPYRSYGLYGYSGFRSGSFHGFSPFYGDYYVPQTTFGKQSVGWKHLANGKIERAKEKFSRLQRKSPKSGLPRVGLSLSAAFSEDYDKAAHEMRLAFIQDPEGAGDLPSRPRLKERLGVLRDYYRGIVISDRNDADSAFMLAALSYLLNDTQSALMAIRDAIDHGDDSTSAQNLKKLLV